MEKDVVKVTAIKINFKIYEKNIAGPDKPHVLNLETRQGEKAHYAPYSKCVSHVGSTDALDLAQYLDGYDDADNRTIFHNALKMASEWDLAGEL